MRNSPEDKLSEAQIAAVDAVTDFSEAMATGNLSILDLEAAFSLAIEDGWDMAIIQLEMAKIALQRARNRK